MKSILIVEDESSVAEMLASVFQQEGYYVQAKPTAGDALAFCNSIVPDLILSDLKSGEMDGLMLLEQIYSEDKLKNVPFVVVTASGELAILRKAMELGATAYVTKPVEPVELVKTVKRLVPPDD